MIRDQFLLGIDNEIIVDLFAGGGGMSTAIEQALGRHVDIAIILTELARMEAAIRKGEAV